MGSWDGVCGYHAPHIHTHKGKAGRATGILTHCRAESMGLQLNPENLRTRSWLPKTAGSSEE